jgi:hypothetical protein
MLQETNGPHTTLIGASVVVEPHTSSPFPNNRLSEQEQAGNGTMGQPATILWKSASGSGWSPTKCSSP